MQTFPLGRFSVGRIGFGAIQLPGPGAFVPFFALRSPFAPADQVLGQDAVVRAAARLGHTPAQIASAWTLSVAPNVLMIPGTSSVQHLEENLAVADIELDDDAREQLNAVTA
jgi:aryl-alcohol dehydrogenase-like predicted oxidoreductase